MTKEVTISRGYTALVDDDDYELVSKYKWFASPGWGHHVCAKRWLTKRIPGVVRKATTIGHDVLGLKFGAADIPGKVIDHINGNELDNRKCNLRIATRSENAQNSKRVRDYKGVYYEPSRRTWKSFLLNGDSSRIYIGTFRTEDEATLHQLLAREGEEIVRCSP